MACRKSAHGRHRHRRSRKWHSGAAPEVRARKSLRRMLIDAIARVVFAVCVWLYLARQNCSRRTGQEHVGEQHAETPGEEKGSAFT
eukprot:15377870-Alexandrium_andersonii.AAC.1